MVHFQDIQQSFLALGDDQQDYWQWSAIGISLAAAFGISLLLRKTLFSKGSRCQTALTRFFDPGKRVSSTPIVCAILLWMTWAARGSWSNKLVLTGADALPSNYIHTAALLVSAYVVYRITTAVSKGQAAPKFIGGGILFLFALHLFGWLEPVSAAFQTIRIPLGSVEINLWAIFSAIAALFLLLWLAGLSTRFLDAFVKPRNDIPPTIKVLIGKAGRLALYTAAILGALKIGGVPLGGLAIFSGALGLGVGFGLQKVISNLFSGVIILLDKSIKPGDVIEIEGTFGWINSLRTRYISVITRDRKEILIPNEDFVTNKVVNWSFTDRIVRIKADVGVSYDTNVPEAIDICIAAANSITRVLKTPQPSCLLMGFGDSSIDLQIRFWINDAPQGVSNVRSEVLLAVWKAFRDKGIEIPFPQRDIHIKSGILPADQSLPSTES
ncbi:MAG: mechanosensitive ion channel family protein [Akkermansiaceae bacterium]